MSDKYIGKELVLYEVDVQSDGTYVFYEELWLVPKFYDTTRGLYTCEMLTGDKRDGEMVKVHESQFNAINWSNDDE